MQFERADAADMPIASLYRIQGRSVLRAIYIISYAQMPEQGDRLGRPLHIKKAFRLQFAIPHIIGNEIHFQLLIVFFKIFLFLPGVQTLFSVRSQVRKQFQNKGELISV